MWASTLRRLTGAGAMVVGLDRDAAALRKALKNQSGEVELILAEASHLPFKDGHFDLVTCRRLLINLRARVRRKVLYEMIRVATVGGTIAPVEPSLQVNSANQFSTVSGSFRFSKRLEKAVTGTDFDFGPKAAQLLLSCGLEKVQVWAYLLLNTVLPPRYSKIILNSLVHDGRFAHALRTVHPPLRGAIGRRLQREASRLDLEMRRQIARGQFASVSVMPMFVTKGTKSSSRKEQP